MKIEIGESLTYSYLKHIEGCRIVQTNWKTSGNWVTTEFEKEQSKLFFNKVKKSSVFDDIFKNSTFEQLLKQAEIDVLGINTAENTVYGIDVAFHSAGINYGSKEETTDRIIKKIFRTIFVMQTYFSEYDKFESIFITPKVNPATQTLIDKAINQAKEIILDENIRIDFIANDRFYNEIVTPVVDNIKNENDTSELFARAVKLLQLDKKGRLNIDKTHMPEKKSSTNKRTVNGMKIGQFVQHVFRDAFEKGLISLNQIRNLQELQYSIDTFNSRYEVLRTKNKKIKDENGRNRYYTSELYCGDYYLTSQWVEQQWDHLLKWLSSIGYEVNEGEWNENEQTLLTKCVNKKNYLTPTEDIEAEETNNLGMDENNLVPNDTRNNFIVSQNILGNGNIIQVTFINGGTHDGERYIYDHDKLVEACRVHLHQNPTWNNVGNYTSSNNIPGWAMITGLIKKIK
jgi:hypothetical protein|tara:strand:+ start:861 stop:2231 length:1371 start_codon:yes stop_codon:yes gene_type:complete